VSEQSPTTGDGSVTLWLAELAHGSVDAAQAIWDRYFAAMVRLADGRLRGAARRVIDAEDVALSAFHCFCQGVAAGRFPQLRDRDNLWPLLVVLTARKACNARRREEAAKRGGDPARLGTVGDVESDHGIDQVIGNEPTPAFAAEVADELARLLAALDRDVLREVAVWKLQGYSNAEIAAGHGVSERTVERRLDLIRKLLRKVVETGPPPDAPAG